MTSPPLHELWHATPATAALFCCLGVLVAPALRAQAPSPAPASPPAAPAPVPAPAAPGAAPPAIAPPVAPAPTAPAAPLDQGPDTLPSLESSPEVVELPQQPGVAVVAVGPVRAALPVRAERRLALLGELSWNGLAGFGPNLTFHAYPQLSIDLGAGLALVGWKLGLRTRYDFLKSEVTPFVGVGFLAASGFDAPSQDLTSENDNRELNIKLRPSAFFQATVGIDYTDSDGFTFLGSLGYAWLISNDNVVIVTGEPTPEEQRALNIIFGSSLVLSIGIGYSFR
jgi:hypothetical protein